MYLLHLLSYFNIQLRRTQQSTKIPIILQYKLSECIPFCIIIPNQSLTTIRFDFPSLLYPLSVCSSQPFTLRKPNLQHIKSSDIINFIFRPIYLCLLASDLHLRFQTALIPIFYQKQQILSGTTHLAKKGHPINNYPTSLR